MTQSSMCLGFRDHVYSRRGCEFLPAATDDQVLLQPQDREQTRL